MNLRKKYMLLSVLVLAGLIAIAQAPPSTSPIGKAEAVVYTLTFTKFELQDDAGTWHVVNDTATPVNIASASSGALAAAIAGAATTLPAGHYKAFRSEVSGTMGIKGYWYDGVGKTYYTTSATKAVAAPPGQSPDGFGIVPGIYNGTAAAFLAAAGADGTGVTPAYAEGSIRPPTVTTTFIGGQGTEDITVGVDADSPVTEELIVDLTDTIQVWDFEGGDGIGDVIFPGTPSIVLN